MKLRWQSHALEDLASIRSYVAADDPSAARCLVTTLLTFVQEQLTTFPQSGRTGRIEGTRELVVPRTPFIVAYRIKEETIDILAVHHTARRWPDRFGE
jgi:addiction module RelE/StbE family toxin